MTPENSADELTPAKTFFGPREYQVLLDKFGGADEKLNRVVEACASITDNQMQMISLYHELKIEQTSLGKRLTTVEVSRVWAPYLLFIMNLAATLYLYQSMQPLFHR